MNKTSMNAADVLVKLLAEKGWKITQTLANGHDNLAAFFVHTQTQQTLMINAYVFPEGARAQLHLHGLTEQMDSTGKDFLTACLKGLEAMVYIPGVPENIRDSIMLNGDVYA